MPTLSKHYNPMTKLLLEALFSNSLWEQKIWEQTRVPKINVLSRLKRMIQECNETKEYLAVRIDGKTKTHANRSVEDRTVLIVVDPVKVRMLQAGGPLGEYEKTRSLLCQPFTAQPFFIYSKC